MKSINDLTQNLSGYRHTSSEFSQDSSQTKPLTMASINNLFEKLSGMFGHRFDSGFAGTQEIWLACLKDLTPRDLAFGLEKLSNSGFEWPPAAPQFKAMCKPTEKDMGLPSVDEAYMAICQLMNTGGQAKWQDAHPAIYDAYQRLDSFTFKNATGSYHQKIFKTAYGQTLSMVAQGYELPPVPKALEHKPEEGDARSDSRKAEAGTNMGAILASF